MVQAVQIVSDSTVCAAVPLDVGVVGDFDESIDDGGKSVRAFQPVISPGFRTALVNREKLQVVVGAAAPIGLNRKADNDGELLYLSIEHDFQ